MQQLPPQGKWCAPSVCVGLKAVLQHCTEATAFAFSIVPLSPPKSEPKPDKKQGQGQGQGGGGVLDRRSSLLPRAAEDAPPPPPPIKTSGRKHPSPPTAAVPLPPPPTTTTTTAPVTVPPLNLSKISKLPVEAAASQPPAVGLLASHRLLPATAFMAVSERGTDRGSVSFCVPRGMGKYFRSRHLQLPLQQQQQQQQQQEHKHHPIVTSRQPGPPVEKLRAGV